MIIAAGTIQYDGSLSGILNRFSNVKRVTFQLAEGQSFEGLDRFAPVETLLEPKVQYRVPRSDVPKLLSRMLDAKRVVDVTVEDPPLEEIIAELFTQASQNQKDSSPEWLGGK